MQQPCSRCGYISDRPARFCRQCGSQLVAETEASSATTRNYAHPAGQYANPQSNYPAYAPQQQWDDQTPETTPFYRPPIASQYQPPVVEQKRTNWGKWVLLSLLTFMMICIVAVGGLFYMGKRWVEQHRPAPSGDVPVVVPGVPPPPGAPPAPPLAGNLESYKYPGAKVTESHKGGGSEMIQMTTDDSLDDVLQYYEEKFKNATTIHDEDGKKFIFTSLGQPLTTVIVQPDEKQEDKTQILLTRVNISIPKISIPPIKIP